MDKAQENSKHLRQIFVLLIFCCGTLDQMLSPINVLFLDLLFAYASVACVWTSCAEAGTFESEE